VLSLATPARHDSPWWPFGLTLSYARVAGSPGVEPRLLAGGQVAVLGLVGVVFAWLVRSRRGALLGGLALGAGIWIAVPPLVVDAHPTTYQRPAVPYQASSIIEGAGRYDALCATCHGDSGKGDGVRGANLPKRPADLMSRRTTSQTAGDLYWWVTNGVPGSGMPPFSDRLSEDERWDVVNFLRALGAGADADQLTPLVKPSVPGPVAPDFVYAVGPTPPRTLREFRGRRVVLLVFFSLPASRGRLQQLAREYMTLQILGADVLAVPAAASTNVIAAMGSDPPILFPVVTDGAADIPETYRLFTATTRQSTPSHVEFLIDRQGYLRGRWTPFRPGPGWNDAAVLEDQVRRLAAETSSAPLPDEHVH